MTRKLIITIQFILVGILCIGCSGRQKEPNIREAQIIELSQEQVSIDENLQLSILLNNAIHLIDMTYYEFYNFNFDNNQNSFFVANAPRFSTNNKIGFHIDAMSIIFEQSVLYIFMLYYSNENVFYTFKEKMNMYLYPIIFNTLLNNCESNKMIGSRQYKLYKAIYFEPRATMDEIVNILEEEL